jgi:hypothetical protein
MVLLDCAVPSLSSSFLDKRVEPSILHSAKLVFSLRRFTLIFRLYSHTAVLILSSCFGDEPLLVRQQLANLAAPDRSVLSFGRAWGALRGFLELQNGKKRDRSTRRRRRGTVAAADARQKEFER